MRKVIFTISTLLALSLMLSFNANAQKLGKFGSSTEKTVGPKTVKVPYTSVISYFGYAAPGNEDEVKDGKKYYYIYVWIPAVAPELGVRMMSPAGGLKIKNATMSESYTKNKGSKDYFDTYITIEKSNISKSSDVNAEKVKSAEWTVLAKNDDSSEMPPLPNGSNYNSLLRYKSEASNPNKALTAGLYRIGFTTYKTGEVKGTFLAQVAAPIKLPGVIMNVSLEELIKALN